MQVALCFKVNISLCFKVNIRPIQEAVVSGVTVTVPRAATPPPGPSGTKRHATDDELTPIKAPKRRRRDVRPKRQAAKDAEEV